MKNIKIEILFIVLLGISCNSLSDKPAAKPENNLDALYEDSITIENNYDFDTCIWVSKTEMKKLNLSEIEKLKITSRIIDSRNTEKIEWIGHGTKEISEKIIYFDSITYFGLCNYRPDNYWKLNSFDTLGKTLFVNNIQFNPNDTISSGNLLFLKLVDGFG